MEVHKIDYGQRVYQGTLDAVRQVIIATMLVIDSYNGETIGEPWISDRDEYVAGTTPSTGAQVAYTLDEPLEIPVAVSNLPIRTLSGYNHIESTTGEMEIEYITEGYQPLVDLIQSSKHVYSTQEQIVGTWVDGSTLYERTIYISGTLVMESENTWIDSGVDISYVDRFVSFDAIMYDGSGVPALWCGKSNNHLTLLSSRRNTFNGLYVVIRYTKTTQTRSLNAPLTSQKAQIEPLTDKTEEVPTEEKAVNEEENNDDKR